MQLGSIHCYVPRSITGEKACFRMLRSSQETPVVSNKMQSQTLNVKCWRDKQSGIIYLDTAGMFENRGEEEKLWTKYCNSMIYSMVGGVQAIVITISYKAIFDSIRGNEYAQFAEEVMDVTMGNRELYNSMVFLITNIRTQDGDVEPAWLVADIKEFIKGIKSTVKTIMIKLGKDYPTLMPNKKFDETAAAAAGDHRLKELEDLDNRIALLEQMKDESRFVLSNPDGETKCSSIRNELLRKIHGRSVPTQVLNEHCQSNSDYSFPIQTVASLLVGDQLNDVSELARLLRDEDKRLSSPEMADLVASDENSWKSVRDSLIDQKNTDIDNLRVEVKTKKAKKTKLEESMDKVAIDEEHIRKKFTTNFLYCEFLVGALTASDDYNYRGQPFVSYKFDGEKFGTKDKVVEKEKGKLAATFTSENGHNLDVNVSVMVYRKDHPSTIQMVARLKREIDALEDEIKKIKRTIRSYNAASNRQAFVNVVDSAGRETKEQIKKLEDHLLKPLTSPYSEDATYSLWQCMDSLMTFFQLADDTSSWHENLSIEVRETVSSFRKHWRAINELRQSERVKQIIPVAPVVHTTLPKDAVPPKHSTLYEMLTASGEKIQQINKATEGIGSHKLEVGGSCITVGSMMWIHMMVNWSSLAHPNFFLLVVMTINLFGMYNMLGWARSTSTEVVEALSEIGRRQQRELIGLSNSLARELQNEFHMTADRTDELSKRLVDKFKCSINFDIKKITFSSLVSVAFAKLWECVGK